MSSLEYSPGRGAGRLAVGTNDAHLGIISLPDRGERKSVE